MDQVANACSQNQNAEITISTPCWRFIVHGGYDGS